MNDKIAALKAALAARKNKGKYPAKPGKANDVENPMEDAHENPAIENEEHTPTKKAPLPVKGKGAKKTAKSKAPAWVKPKGTVENPVASEDPAKGAKKRPQFFQKAKTR